MNKTKAITQTIKQETAGSKASLSGGLFLGMPQKEQIAFAKRLAILIKAGVPILTALNMLKNQAGSRGAKTIIGHLESEVEKGQSMSEAMKRFKNVFGAFAVNIVRVGEVSGTLVENLNYLAEELRKKEELKKNIIGAMIYPIFIVVATIGIVILLTTYVFPKILPIFESFKSELPWSTRALIAVSTAVRQDWLYLLAGVAALAVALVLLVKLPPVRLLVDRNSLRFPLIGPMFKSYQIANFTRTLGLLLKSDVSIVEALQIVKNTAGNAAYRRRFDEIAAGVARGERMSRAMEKDKLLFPPVVAQMAAVGETTGNLSASLLYLSEMHEDEMNGLTKALASSVEPMLMVFMGLLVGFIAISIITPIYGITQNLRN